MRLLYSEAGSLPGAAALFNLNADAGVVRGAPTFLSRADARRLLATTDTGQARCSVRSGAFDPEAGHPLAAYAARLARDN